ncbi:MAG: hypothetical protein JSV57_02615 [Candidatus Bathyarchaeota archaeon]|nr:MAG: hypothetical protein JSV57_02615 [Candidatus Bathyarchaeota archaeon]
MSEVFPSIAYQLGIGGFGGFFVGYVFKKVIKIAIIIGILVFALIFFAYGDVINVNYSELIESISGYAGTAWQFLTPLLSNLPFVGSFILGLMLGLRVG